MSAEERVQKEKPAGGLKLLVRLIGDTIREWGNDNAARLAAALAYYTVFSLAPLLIIAIAIIGLAFGRDAAQGRIVQQLGGLIGPDSAELVQGMIQQASRPAEGTLAAIIGIVTLVLGATGLFGELQSSLNQIWDVPPKPDGGIGAMIRQRFVSLAMVLGIGFLLLVSLIASTVVSGLSDAIASQVPGLDVLSQVLTFALNFIVSTVLFAMIFKVLPDTHVAWRDVWLGSVITSILFSIGRWLIGLYMGNSSYTSTYGAAGSLVVLLVWVYYSAQILFLGAEFTQVYSRTRGSRRSESGHLVTADSRVEADGDATQPAPRGQAALRPSVASMAVAVVALLGVFVAGATRNGKERG